MQTLLTPAYVLHRRLYRETSFLVELFSEQHGRLTVIAKGVRKARTSTPGLLQAFMPLLVSWNGKGELKVLTQVELNGTANHLQGNCLFAGLYINELLMCLLQKWDAHHYLYRIYADTIRALQTQQLSEGILRSFEKVLLEELGYGLLPISDELLHKTFSADKYYRFTSEQGFTICEEVNAYTAANVFSGKSLIAMAKEDWREETSLRDAKRLIRYVLSPLLGARPIHSRRLFMHL